MGINKERIRKINKEGKEIKWNTKVRNERK
jgi:hypothetical protein